MSEDKETQGRNPEDASMVKTDDGTEASGEDVTGSAGVEAKDTADDAAASTPADAKSAADDAAGSTAADETETSSSSAGATHSKEAPENAQQELDLERPSEIEVEPESVESAPAAPKASPNLPPPPPSARAQGATSRLELSGDPKIASDLMTRKIFTISPEDVIAHLEEQMQAFRFRHLPVVENHKLVGLITHRDLLHASSSFLSPMAKERDELIHKVRARRIMQTDLVTVRPTESLTEVARQMWEAKIGCVLVTDEEKKLLGVITEADFIRLAYHHLAQSEKSSS